MCHKINFFLLKEEQDAMFLISESNFNSLTVKGKKRVSKCLFYTESECSQDYVMTGI